MKKMKTTIATTVALAACVGTQLFAQNTKEDIITFSLSVSAQSSVSDTSAQNHGSWLSPATKYKTMTKQLTQKDLIQAIAFVAHDKIYNWYGSSANLVLVQGELGGFFNITPDLAASTENYTEDGILDGTFTTDTTDGSTLLANSTDTTFSTFPNGRHFELNPDTDHDFYPVGHMQPWGQIYVKYVKSGVTLCENVTYFFGIAVQECYDCFYLNSYISDSTFTKKTVTGSQNGPPCCNVSQDQYFLGNGKDRYYMTLTFDNTVNNPYLSSNSPAATWVGIQGIEDLIADGIHPDTADYDPLILSHLGNPSPFEVRFTLNGIMTYTWNLKFINSSDISPDFVGTGTLAANGYGFIQLYCSLLTGNVKFAEKLVKISTCCNDIPWYDNWYGVGHYNTDGYAYEGSNAFLDESESYTSPTPFNDGPSLSYHASFDEEYIPYRTHDIW